MDVYKCTLELPRDKMCVGVGRWSGPHETNKFNKTKIYVVNSPAEIGMKNMYKTPL